jgi:hypothetical protein
MLRTPLSFGDGQALRPGLAPRDTAESQSGETMPQEQSQKSGDPPIGTCAVCGKAVTREDPGTLRFSSADGALSHVHTRCQPDTDSGSAAS